ncbi:hypothetical protein [Methylophilus sp. QUAN]|uniref:hypothetical protein n=1 Tax=Methylophilus sp. QUAN TaxID=2781020 RepID=UPI00188ECBEC|nr:hypothetical protein [Methylophilus sp. QUAN]MBF4990671.1 hypothetical protein [Methylophilus sp. QUAN]
MAAFLFLVTVVICLIPFFKPDVLTANPQRVMTKKAWIAGAVSLYFLAIVAMAIFHQETTLPPGTVGDRIQFVVRDVESVVDLGETLQITYSRKSIYDGKDWVYGFADDAKKIIERFPELANGKKYKKLAFLVQVPTTDNLGHEGSVNGMKVFYDMEIFKGANFNNMVTYDYLELPEEIIFKRFGRENALEYCKSNLDVNKKFCAKALLK